MSQSKSEVRDRFSEQITSLAEVAKAQGTALRGTGQRLQYSPPLNGWDGDCRDLEGVGKPFDRDENKADVEAAISDLEKAGTTGDLVGSTLQGDVLSTLERSYRTRTSSRVRRTIHASARRSGHGHDGGLFLRGFLGFVEGVLMQSKDVQE